VIHLKPGDMDWDEDCYGYTKYFVGKADGDLFVSYDRDHANAVADLERRRHEEQKEEKA
jgi:hypothetical protein